MALQRISRICRVSSKNVSVISRNLTTSEQKPIYELRCYNVYPKDFKRFLDLTTEWIAVRTKYSKMMGYWTSEIGGLNDVLHIWEYDSLSHRASVRKALSGDEEWAKNYFSLILPMLIRQDNSLMKLVPDTVFKTDVDKGGVYELQTITPSTDHDHHPRNILGRFHGILGSLNTEYKLIHYPDINQIVQDKRLNRDIPGSSRLLQPCSFSPLG